MKLLRTLLAPREKNNGRARLRAGHAFPFIYAVGDVHGCLDQLKALEEKIVADRARLKTSGEALIVMLGDYVDRGPCSAGVLDHLLAPPPAGFRRICLAGNHEEVMLAFLSDPAGNRQWLGFGGTETLASYGVDEQTLLRATEAGAQGLRNLLAAHIPEEHQRFLSELPVSLETVGHFFCHAGIRPGVPLAAQSDDDLVWIRAPFDEFYGEAEKVIVHGHIPRAEPLVAPRRIAIDTAACVSGRLSSVRIAPGAPPLILDSRDD